MEKFVPCEKCKGKKDWLLCTDCTVRLVQQRKEEYPSAFGGQVECLVIISTISGFGGEREPAPFHLGRKYDDDDSQYKTRESLNDHCNVYIHLDCD